MVSRIDNKSPQCDSAAGYDHDPSPGPPEPGRVIPARGIYGPAARLVITAEGCAEQAAWKSALAPGDREHARHRAEHGPANQQPQHETALAAAGVELGCRSSSSSCSSSRTRHSRNGVASSKNCAMLLE